MEIVRRGGNRESDGYHYTAEALATFPRYNVLNAIRVEIERIDTTALRDFESAKAIVLRAGNAANDDFTRKPIGLIDKRAIEEERETFCSYIEGLTPTVLNTVQPLPFRRVLAKDESGAIWSRLRDRWQIPEGYWYPLNSCTVPDVEAFDEHAFNDSVSPERLQGILRLRGVERVWEFREFGPEYEQDLSLFDPCYNGAEGYWSSDSLNWIVYASHEGSVTIGGWPLEEIKALWPTWASHVWRETF